MYFSRSPEIEGSLAGAAGGVATCWCPTRPRVSNCRRKASLPWTERAGTSDQTLDLSGCMSSVVLHRVGLCVCRK